VKDRELHAEVRQSLSLLALTMASLASVLGLGLLAASVLS